MLLVFSAGIYAVPTAAISNSPPFVLCENESINLRVHQSVFADSLTVNWGDGTPVESYTLNPTQVSHSYSTAGVYVFTLIAYDPGVTDTFQTTITVIEIPIALFTHSLNDTVCSGNSVQFTDQSIFTGTVSYFWTFGDGGMSNTANPLKAYALPGTYIVKLLVYNSNCSDDFTDTITVTADTLLADDFTMSIGCPCNKITFNAIGTASSWTWDLGNTDMAFGQNVVYDYPKPGQYIVTLKGTDNACSWSIKKTITVCGPDIVDTSRSNANWYIGGGPIFPGPATPPAGIHFGNAGVTTSATGGLIANEGVACMSDSKSGTLLFYTEGVNIYDKTHAVMSQGNNLKGDWSAVQSSLIVPFPGDRSKYYLFTVNGCTGTLQGYYYSVVDMSLNGGLGQVIQKNIPLYTRAMDSCFSAQSQVGIPYESITGVERLRPTCIQNGEYWVVIPSCHNEFRSYLITDQGIQNPVFSTSPYRIGFGGASRISSDGKKYIITYPIGQAPPSPGSATYPSLLMMDFDMNTGILSNQTGDDKQFGHGVCFSKDNSRLYIGYFDSLVQYDMLAADFWKSKKTIVKYPGTSNSFVSMYMGIDDKIYVSRRSASYIGRINNPNSLGTACNYIDVVLNLPGSAKAKDGLQNIISLPPIDSSISMFTNTTPACGNFTVMFTNLSDSILPPTPPPCSFPRVADSLTYQWTFGDGSVIEKYYVTDNGPANLFHPTHVYSPGTYTVSLITSSNFKCIPDTFLSVVNIDTVPTATITGGDTICSGNNTVLIASGGSSYSWNAGPASAVNNVSPTTPTTYTVVVSNGVCTDTTTFFVDVMNLSVVTITGNNSICTGDSIMLTASGANSYSWNFGSSSPLIIQHPGAGVTGYTVTGSNQQGCSVDAVISVTVNANPIAQVSDDDTICAGENVLLTASGGNSYSWNTGAATPAINQSPAISSLFSVTVSNANCVDTTSVFITVNQPSVVAAGNDTTIIKGNSVVLTSAGGSNCLWSPSSGLSCINCCSPTATPVSTTTYYVTITDENGCTSMDSVLVDIEDPQVNCEEIKFPMHFPQMKMDKMMY